MSKPKFNISKKENRIKFKIDGEIYDLDVVYGAAYSFVDKAYIYLDGDPEEKIEVYLKGKDSLKKKELENIAGEFLNELINVRLRFQISEKNKKIREYITSAALVGASRELKEEFNKSQEQEEPVWEKDPENIAVPWEEKNREEDEKEEKLYKEDSDGVVVPWKDN